MCSGSKTLCSYSPLGTKSVGLDLVRESGDLSLSLLADLEGKDTDLVAARHQNRSNPQSPCRFESGVTHLTMQPRTDFLLLSPSRRSR